MCTLREGDYALIVFDERRVFMARLRRGGRTGSDVGVVEHNDVIGAPCGAYIPVRGGRGGYAIVLKPLLLDFLEHGFARATQVIYPKDSARIAMLTGIGPGSRVVEVGTGSGFMTAVLAWLVGDEGRVYTYEVRRHAIETAKRNLEALGVAHRVVFHEGDARLGVEERDVDAFVVDAPDPWDLLDVAYEALRPGGVFAAYTPSVHQVHMLLEALSGHGGFVLPRVEEVLIRPWLPDPEALRPETTMVAHTGFIIAARKVARR
jgi:tRNA (adenine57-N1/adenine58-N1)-methyltransferase